MKTSSIYLLAGIIIFVIGTFVWQYILHLQLQSTPLSCTGGLYFSNSCPLGQGCYYSTSSTTARNSNRPDPELNSAAQTIIDFRTGAAIRQGTGTCQPWLNNLFQISSE